MALEVIIKNVLTGRRVGVHLLKGDREGFVVEGANANPFVDRGTRTIVAISDTRDVGRVQVLNGGLDSELRMVDRLEMIGHLASGSFSAFPYKVEVFGIRE